MDFSPNKTPVEKTKEGAEVLILEMFVLILIKNGIKIHGKNLFI